MAYKPTQAPNKCENMNHIRAEIDQIDHSIIKLFATRFEYVKAASKFKKNTTGCTSQRTF
ncbi:MAG: chorismate mutase [Gilliamella sp.]|nr:chorismate mutase [Gilliamella sp.]